MPLLTATSTFWIREKTLEFSTVLSTLSIPYYHTRDIKIISPLRTMELCYPFESTTMNAVGSQSGRVRNVLYEFVQENYWH